MSDKIKLQASLTPQEVADMLKISKNMVYELVKRKELPGYRVGNKLRVDPDDVKSYIDSSRTAAPAPAAAPKTERWNPLLSESAPVWNGFIISGKDLALDILSRRLEEYRPAQRILRSYLGSYNGLYGLYNDEVQMAAAHLWDGATGEYNKPYIRSLLPGTPVVLMNLAYRIQGFYVLKGNPKNIRTWEDLKRPDVSFANREKGSGTRILLDEHLRLMGMRGERLKGYGRVCLTHLAAAAVVARGGADAALGIEKTAAQVGNIEFIPLQKERYDLVFKQENGAEPLCRAAADIVRSQEFREELQSIGGYDVSETGTISEDFPGRTQAASVPRA